MSKGKLIVLYGINNLGKTTQVKLLVENLKKAGRKVLTGKIPVYRLDPTGIMINEYLRKGNPYNFAMKDIQILYAYNRMQYEPELKAILAGGTNVVLEDYWGTGVAWGIGYGVEKELLLRLNKPFMWEDLAILLDGERFVSGIEKNHKHEQDKELTEKVRAAHLELGEQFFWKKINANKSIEEVSKAVWGEVKNIF
ncbi:MAG: hypothetical protein COT91_02180 [Candidatus Doudnabacteria bacterium CG10_big_fil_rev_8_21_14_0_10_41_10]|uniref:Thymidylate kinase-like domain-containing protein n=1 Tax=Candidatus Doudnabacteria bacterium CG10_big_fil_rev_8_21_14_0_10_41_10 TaxID=1974551 RepID=A0A2H0VDV1_9BACT|nr:MAG: hypothetical protein COT91_02180 [Candidatus Doudnabacteria bacterium CG10_big_fil_rev_8_21_14_0_10_41_10]